MKNLSIPWRTAASWSHTKIPTHLRPFLLDPTSSTRWLQQLSKHNLRVEVLGQGQQSLTASEQRLLQVRPRICALIREVKLYGNDEPWMLGRSVFLNSTLKGKTKFFSYELDERPLGQLLFRSPTLQRSEFELALLQPEQREYIFVKNAIPTSEPLWARRSLFFIHAKPVLLVEVFLPALVERLYT